MTHSVDQALRAFKPQLPMAVALSGGADSTALLAACAEKWPNQVTALHVNHGLQAAASTFEAQCVALCGQLKLPLRVAHVQVVRAAAESPEEAARRARYGALVGLTRIEAAQTAIHSIAIAQHANDQVETVLLALSRGAGLAGLSGMAPVWVREGITFHRPLLNVAAADIRAWLAVRALPFCEDPTNVDVRFTRNRIRHDVMPALLGAFPQALDTLARSARHAAQGQEILNEVGLEDWQGAAVDGVPQIKQLQLLGPSRQANALRVWLKTAYSVIPSQAQLAELQHQIGACRTRGHRIHIKVGTGFVERLRLGLTWYNP